MSNTYEINESHQVIPYTSGRKCNDSRSWRDATDLELQQKDEIEELKIEIEDLKGDLEFRRELYKVLSERCDRRTVELAEERVKFSEKLDEANKSHWQTLLSLRDAAFTLDAILTGEILRGEINSKIIECLDRLKGNFPLH